MLVRRHFGVAAFGVNIWRGAEAGDRVIDEHEELNEDHQELYIVLTGRATFSLDGTSVPASAGTLVYVEPPVMRGAVAVDPETRVLALGGEPGRPFSPSPWEEWGARELPMLLAQRRFDEAVSRYAPVVEREPDHGGARYNLACLLALSGRPDEALEHLARAIELQPRNAEYAREDADFDGLRADPRFTELVEGRNAPAAVVSPAMTEPGWMVTTLDALPAIPYLEGSTWRRIRMHFGISAFGVNAYGAEAGTRVIEEHDELGSNAGRHEELYLVLSGRATFTLDRETADARAGTFVHVPDPATRRGAIAEDDGTVVLVIGGKVGEAFTPSPWELAAPAWDAYTAKDYARAADELRPLAEQFPDSAATLYNLACFEALDGRRDEALGHLARAVELDAKLAALAADDDDFASVRDDPRFPAG